MLKTGIWVYAAVGFLFITGLIVSYKYVHDQKRLHQAVQNMDTNQSVSAVQNMDAIQAVPVVQNMDTNQAVPYVQNIGTSQAVPVVQNIGTIQAVPAVQNMDTNQAVPSVQNIGTSQAVPSVQNMATNQVVPAVQNVDTIQVVPAVQNMDTNQAVPAEQNVDTIQVVPVAPVKYKGRDLMKVMRPNFDPNFKSPCWYETSGISKRLRCLPFFYIIGVKKCGTSYLFGVIKRQPDFAADAVRKEIHWFDRWRFNKSSGDNINTYIQLFDVAARKIEEMQKDINGSQKKNVLTTGEATPGYLHLNTKWRYLPGNEHMTEPKYLIIDYIHHLIPTAKIIIVFRDPVKRLYSDYFHTFMRLRGDPASAEHFHALVTDGLRLYKDCFQRYTVRSCVYNESLYRHTKMHIQLGIYYVYWQDLLRVFPREQLLIVHNEDMAENPAKPLAEVFKFLQMRYLSQSELKSTAQTTGTFSSNYKKVGGAMLSETANLLQDFYRPFNKKMFEITKDKRFLYTY